MTKKSINAYATTIIDCINLGIEMGIGMSIDNIKDTLENLI
jgi:hypothetical protein